jgi:hypothetical protein
MARYMLSVHSREGEVRDQPTHEEMQQSHARLRQIEQEMSATGAWVFSGRLHPRTPLPSCASPMVRC